MTGHVQPEFHYADLVFDLVPERSLYWPEVQRGSILRGAFGSLLKEIACDPLCASPSQCAFAAGCAYEKLFAPLTPVSAERLSLNQDLPRPFVIAPDDFLGETVRPGQKFSF